MKLKVDREADALYLTLDENAAVETEQVAPGIVVDYGADRRVVGIEMRYLSKRAPRLDTERLLFETVAASTH